MKEEKILNYLNLVLKIKEEKNNATSLNDFISKIQKLLENLKITLKTQKNPNYKSNNPHERVIPIETSNVILVVNTEKILTNEDLILIEILEKEIKEFLERDEYIRFKKEAEFFNKLTLSLISKTDIKELLEQILIELKEIIPYTSANIALLENDTTTYLLITGYEKYNSQKFMENFKLEKEKFYTLRTVLETKKPLIIENTDEFPYWVKIPETSWIKAHIMIPILHNDQIIGLLSFDFDKPYSFSQDDVNKIYPTIPILAITLENAKLYEELKQKLEEKIEIENKLRRSLYQVIKTASDIVEMKDPYTAGHQKKVARISTIIGKTLNLPPEKIRNLAIGSLLHDIGKITIPSEILNKPSSLNPLERKLINMHCQIGYDLIRKIEAISEVAPIILQHHERLNGSGYPLGLKGEEILLEARIVAVADVVEAMTSHRPYRPALPLEIVIKELESNKGILYDTDVVDAFLISLKKGRIQL